MFMKAVSESSSSSYKIFSLSLKPKVEFLPLKPCKGHNCKKNVNIEPHFHNFVFLFPLFSCLEMLMLAVNFA